MSKSNEVTTVKSNALPAHLQQYAGSKHTGYEQVKARDLEIPRLQLMHAVSEQVNQKLAEPGDFYHNILNKNLGPSLTIVPIMFTKSLVLWQPRHEGKEIFARSLDGETWTPASGKVEVQPYKDNKKHKVIWQWGESVAESGLAEFGSMDPEDPNSPPAAVEFANFLVYLPDFPEAGPCAIALKRTQLPTARKLNSAIVATCGSKGLPAYCVKFNMSSRLDSSASGDYQNYKFSLDGWTDEEDAKVCAKLLEQFSASGFAVKMDENESGATDDVKAKVRAAEKAGTSKF